MTFGKSWWKFLKAVQKSVKSVGKVWHFGRWLENFAKLMLGDVNSIRNGGISSKKCT